MISVVIPVFNESANIVSTLDAIYHNTQLPAEVIVADGGSTDDTVALIRKHFPQTTVIHNPQKHAGGGRNIGIRKAVGDVIAFTDGDCVVAEDWIEQIEKAFRDDPTLDGVGGKVMTAKPRNKVEAYWCNLAWNLIMNFGDTPYQVKSCTINDTFVTANCAYKKELLLKLNCFSDWFGNNAEDTDLCWRAVKSGAKLLYDPSVRIWARGVTTVKGVMKKSFRNGFSSSKLQKVYGGKVNFDPNIYKMLGKNLIGMICRKPNSGMNSLELCCHLAGKYYGSVKVHVINI